MFVNLRRHFHKHPELGYQEHETAKKIAELLKEWGLEVQEGVATTGVVGVLKGNKVGRTIAIRADIDALPIKEATGLEFASQNEGVMHACSHDGHIAMCLGTAKILSEIKEHLKGNVKFIFQPAEEGPGGAEKMIEEGVLENPSVDAIIGLHIWPEIESGFVGISKGPIMAAADRYEMTIKGLGGHGAKPHLAIDPIIAASHIVTTLQSIVSRELDPLDSTVISNCSFNSGNRFNVIPEEANLSGTVRTFNPKIREEVPRRMESIISGIANSMRCKYDFKYEYYYPATINDKEFTSYFENIAKDILGQEKVFEIERPSMGAEDFSFYLEKVPGTFFFLGTKNEEKEINKPIHHPEYTIDEDILPIGVELFCSMVVDFLKE
nr:amidohydrolase [Sporosalibacterium faouarense]